MKALILKRYGGANHIAFAVIPRPALKPDEMLVQVHAAGLNPIDYMIPKGTFKPMLSFSFRPRWAAIWRVSWWRWEVA
jgi:NADPH:quinone reductase-like Zn-dependent oxidoreductase